MQNSAVAVFGMIFIGEIEQKREIWCLKRKSLYINLHNQYHICDHADFWRKTALFAWY